MRVDEQQICLQNKINAWQTKKKKKWKIERYIQQPVTSSSSSATTIQQTSKSINRILLNEMKCWMEPQFYIASHIPNFIRLHLRSVTGIYIQVLLLFFFFLLTPLSHIYWAFASMSELSDWNHFQKSKTGKMIHYHVQNESILIRKSNKGWHLTERLSIS